MSEEKAPQEETHELPEAVVSNRRHQISIVWFVPLVAILIGGWLVYKTLSEKGPTISISFKSAEGLEAGKTKIKYKDVQLGQVTEIRLTPDLSRVLVTAELVKEAEGFCRPTRDFGSCGPGSRQVRFPDSARFFRGLSSAWIPANQGCPGLNL